MFVLYFFKFYTYNLHSCSVLNSVKFKGFVVEWGSDVRCELLNGKYNLFLICYTKTDMMPQTFGMERDEAITEWPVFHRLIQNDFLFKCNHSDVFEQAQSLQDLLHRLGLWLLRHGTDTHYDLSLWGLQIRTHASQIYAKNRRSILMLETLKGSYSRKSMLFFTLL